jgi:hypothetical protein
MMITVTLYTEYTHKNGAVSKVNEKFISHLTGAQRTPSAAAIVQVSHALPPVRFSCLLRGRGASFQYGLAAGKGFLCAPFWGVQIYDYSARNRRCTVFTDLGTSKRSPQKAFSCCDAILKTGSAESRRSEMLVAHEKLDSCRCWRCKLCPCKVRNKFLVNFWNCTILLCIPCIKRWRFCPQLRGLSWNQRSFPCFRPRKSTSSNMNNRVSAI